MNHSLIVDGPLTIDSVKSAVSMLGSDNYLVEIHVRPDHLDRWTSLPGFSRASFMGLSSVTKPTLIGHLTTIPVYAPQSQAHDEVKTVLSSIKLTYTADNAGGILAQVREWGALIASTEKTCHDLVSLVGLQPESPIITAISTLQERVNKLTSDAIGDEFQWLNWFWLENGMGAEKKKASPGRDIEPMPIATVEDLAWLVASSKTH